MPVFCCNYFLDATQRFLEDSVLKGADEDAIVRSADAHAREIGGDLHLIMLHHLEHTGTYKAANSNTTVHKLVLTDGSYGVFKAQLNTSLSRNIRSWNVPNGSTITVKRWNWIWCDRQNELDCKVIVRGVLLIHDYSWKPAPTDGLCEMMVPCSPAIMLGDDSVSELFDWEVVDYTSEHSFVGWLDRGDKENDDTVLLLLTDDQICQGLFIRHVQTKKDFLSTMTGKAAAYDYTTDYSCDDSDCSGTRGLCNCKTRFGIGVCVCSQFPIATIHQERQSIFDDACTRFDDDARIAETFDELPPSKKRWCMYWWYSINIFQVRGYCNRKRLPDCFVDMIRKQYPNIKGDFFTGYKRSEQKQVDGIRKRAKHLQDLTNEQM